LTVIKIKVKGRLLDKSEHK